MDISKENHVAENFDKRNKIPTFFGRSRWRASNHNHILKFLKMMAMAMVTTMMTMAPIVMMMMMLRGKRWTVVSICGKGRGKPGKPVNSGSTFPYLNLHASSDHDDRDQHLPISEYARTF